MAEDAALAQLAFLREQTRVTGILHDAQVFQLKMWILVVAQHAGDAEIGFDWTKKVVQFKLRSINGPAPANLQVGFENLDNWVKWLLGPEYKVIVKEGRKQLFVGPAKEAAKTTLQRLGLKDD